jgi:hypothetical protein
MRSTASTSGSSVSRSGGWLPVVVMEHRAEADQTTRRYLRCTRGSRPGPLRPRYSV